MKKYLYFLIFLITACQPKQKATDNTITVSILPQKYFVEQIAGDLLKVNVLVPPGSSYHNYTVLPSQMKDLSISKVWLQIGLLTFEEMMIDKLAGINKDLLVANCSEGIDAIAGVACEEEGHDHDHAHHEAFDPHVWMAPAEAKILAKNTFLALKKSFPEHSAVFESNYDRFVTKVDSISEQITQKLAPLTNRHILIFHPALGYYARQFNMVQVSLESEGKEPSPKHMKNIVDQARAENIRVIFIQKEFDTENALQLSREIGGDVVTIDPLDYNWEQQILDITEKIAAGQ
jgi:zinc transport system substrate-binding protein